jgi:hypothetical protein
MTLCRETKSHEARSLCPFGRFSRAPRIQIQHCDSRDALHSRKKPHEITIPIGVRERSIGGAGSIVLGYLKSCRRETISGAATVVVGLEANIVASWRSGSGSIPARRWSAISDRAAF